MLIRIFDGLQQEWLSFQEIRRANACRFVCDATEINTIETRSNSYHSLVQSERCGRCPMHFRCKDKFLQHLMRPCTNTFMSFAHLILAFVLVKPHVFRTDPRTARFEVAKNYYKYLKINDRSLQENSPNQLTKPTIQTKHK